MKEYCNILIFVYILYEDVFYINCLIILYDELFVILSI